MDAQGLMRVVMYLVPLILSLSVHEYAHAIAARRLGDDTATMMGRATLNPISHIDLFGTLLLPGLLIFQGLPVFGWAKPVPFNPLRFNRSVSMNKGIMIVAAAGPLSNLVIALLCASVLGVFSRAGVQVPEAGYALLIQLVQMNVLLALFNFIPVPPLDGSKVLFGLLPARMARVQATIEQYSFLLFILVFMYGWRFISGPYDLVMRGLSVLMGS